MHPTFEGEESRVSLKKGVLTLDNLEIDRYRSILTVDVKANFSRDTHCRT